MQTTAFDERGLKSFIEGLLTGRQKVSAYPASGLPAIGDTEEWDGKDGKVEEDDGGLDDESKFYTQSAVASDVWVCSERLRVVTVMEFLKEQQAEREAEEKAAAELLAAEEAAAGESGGAEDDDDL